jgi:chromate transport protein ChrA
MFIQNFLQVEWVRHAFAGVRIAVLALIADAAVKLWRSGVKDWIGIVIFAAALAVFTFAPISPVAPLLAGAACGIIIRERKKSGRDKKTTINVKKDLHIVNRRAHKKSEPKKGAKQKPGKH